MKIKAVTHWLIYTEKQHFAMLFLKTTIWRFRMVRFRFSLSTDLKSMVTLSQGNSMQTSSPQYCWSRMPQCLFFSFSLHFHGRGFQMLQADTDIQELKASLCSGSPEFPLVGFCPAAEGKLGLRGCRVDWWCLPASSIHLECFWSNVCSFSKPQAYLGWFTYGWICCLSFGGVMSN